MNSTRSKAEISRRYLVFTLALFFIATGVSLITRSLVGTSPISSIPFVMSVNAPLSMGTFIFILNLVLMAGQIAMLGRDGVRRCRVELLMQLPVSVLFGVFVDVTMALFAWWHPDIYVVRLVSLIAGCLVMAFGISLEVLADVSMVSGEYFVHIASQRYRWKFGNVKVAFDLTLVLLAVAVSWFLAGEVAGVREGTLIAAILTGPFVRLIMPRVRDRVTRWETGLQK